MMGQMGSDDGGGDFDARLSAARQRRSLDPPSAEAEKSGPGASSALPASALGIGMRVGVELASALAVAVAIGWALDRWLGTKPLFLVLFVFIGGAAGMLNVWRLVAPMRKPPGGQ